VLAGVVVVGRDDVPEQERGPEVGLVELEQLAQPLLALVGERLQQTEQRHQCENRVGRRVQLLGDHERDRRQSRVDRVHPQAPAQLGPHADSGGGAEVDRRGQEVSCELGREGGQ
jgi:hypothetical protein